MTFMFWHTIRCSLYHITSNKILYFSCVCVKGQPLTSCEASEVHLRYDRSTDSDMEEEFDPRLLEGSLELRMLQVEEKRNKERYFE